MYSLIVQPPDENKPVIDRSLSSNKAIELLPLMVEICRAEFAMENPVAIYVGDNIYHVFDLNNPHVYAKISVLNNQN